MYPITIIVQDLVVLQAGLPTAGLSFFADFLPSQPLSAFFTFADELISLAIVCDRLWN